MPDPIEVRMRRARFALVVVAALAFVVPRLPFISVPLERDEGEYAYIAQRMLEGDVPYRDAFNQKPPAVFVAYLGAFLLLGRSIEAIHAFAHLWTAVTALSCCRPRWIRRRFRSFNSVPCCCSEHLVTWRRRLPPH